MAAHAALLGRGTGIAQALVPVELEAQPEPPGSDQPEEEIERADQDEPGVAALVAVAASTGSTATDTERQPTSVAAVGARSSRAGCSRRSRRSARRRSPASSSTSPRDRTTRHRRRPGRCRLVNRIRRSSARTPSSKTSSSRPCSGAALSTRRRVWARAGARPAHHRQISPPASSIQIVSTSTCSRAEARSAGRTISYDRIWASAAISATAAVGCGAARERLHGPDKPGGRRFCTFEGNVSVIAWMHEKLGQETHKDFLGVARLGGSDHARLFNWWNFWHHRNLGKLPS